MPSLLSGFADIAAVVLVVLFFGGSICIHELGHFLAAKWRKLKVLRFSIGFGPKLLAWKGKDGCEYRISLLPLGGYVAIPQLADMGEIEGGQFGENDIKNLKKATFTDKVVVSVAGAFFNVLLAVFFAILVYFIGVPSVGLPNTTVVGYVYKTENSDTHKKLLPGDKILQIDGENMSNFADIRQAIALGAGRDEKGKPQALLKIERNGQILTLQLKIALVKTNSKTGDFLRMLGIAPAAKIDVASVMENSPAQKAGILPNDEIVSINGQNVYSVADFSDKLNTLKKGEKAKVGIIRNKSEIFADLVPEKIRRTKPLCEVFENGKKIAGLLCVNKSIAQSKGLVSESGILKVFEEADALKDFGIKAGAAIYQIGENKVFSVKDASDALNNAKSPILIKYMDGDTMGEFLLKRPSAKIKDPIENSMVGFTVKQNISIEHPSVLKQIKDGFYTTYAAIATMFNSKSDVGFSHMSGPIGIGRAIYKMSIVDISLAFSFVVLLNLNLAVLNLLPLPVLDGGHILLACIEKLIKKPFSRSAFVKFTQLLFVFLFLSLMVYIIFLDTERWIGESSQETMESLENNYYLTNPSFDKNE